MILIIRKIKYIITDEIDLWTLFDAGIMTLEIKDDGD